MLKGWHVIDPANRIDAPMNVAVVRHLGGAFSFADCGNARMRGSRKLECALTLRAENFSCLAPGG